MRCLLLPLAALALSAQGDPFPVPVERDAWIDASQLEFGPQEGRRTTHYELEVSDRAVLVDENGTIGLTGDFTGF